VVYLVGCDHQTAQTYPAATSLLLPENATQLQFGLFLIDQIKKYAITTVGEESNTDILKRSGRNSVVCEAAHGRATHVYCDPTPQERDELDIGEDLPFFAPGPTAWETLIKSVDQSNLHDIAHRWPIREGFWLDQLAEHSQEQVLFVCGDAHRWTFRHRLEERGIEVKVIAKRFGAAPLSRRFFDAYKSVRRNGFLPKAGCFCVSPINEIKGTEQEE